MNYMRYEKKKYMRLFFAAAIVLITAAAFIFAALPLRANAETEAQDFSPPSEQQTQTKYFCFDDPLELSADGGYLYVLDADTVKRFAVADLSQSDMPVSLTNATSFSVCGESVAAVENGTLKLYGGDAEKEYPDIGNDLRGVYIDSDYIYVQSGATEIKRINRSETDESQIKTLSSASEIKNFAVLGGTVYFSARSRLSARRDNILYFGENDAVCTAVENVPEIISLAGMGENLVAIDGRNLTLYAKGIAELTKSASAETDSDAVSVAAFGTNIFVLDANKAITEYSDGLSVKTCILASASDEPGFFSSPTDVATRMNKTYIADRNNDRIVIHDGEKYSSADGLFRPIAVAADHTGRLFAAYSENRIAVFDAALNRMTSPENETAVFENNARPVAIADLKCDSKSNLYLLSASGAVFIKSADGNAFTPAEGLTQGVAAIDSSPTDAYVYAAQRTENGKISVKRINSSGISDTGISLPSLKDIAADADNGIYVLTDGNVITRYALSGGDPSISETITNCSDITRISVSNVSNSAVGYRDLIVSDTARHRIKTVSCKSFGVDIGDINTPPLDSGEPVKVSESSMLIRTVTNPHGAEVYAQKNEVTLLRTLPYGYKVIVPFFDDDSAFSLVFADNVSIGSSDYEKDGIISGYVHNEFLSEPLPYTDAHERECTAWISSVPVYKYPSRQAPKIDESAETGTAFEILDFVGEETQSGISYGYRDNFPDSDRLQNNHRWFRVALNKDGEKYEGFVVASTVSIFGANPDTSLRPQANAEIIAKDKNVPTAGAVVYFEKDGKFFADNRFEPLPVGTKVEVVGAFDSSEPYTQIKFFTPGGTVTAFVETANIKYQGVNIVKIIAIVLIVITAVLLLILCIRTYKIKKRK